MVSPNIKTYYLRTIAYIGYIAFGCYGCYVLKLISLWFADLIQESRARYFGLFVD